MAKQYHLDFVKPSFVSSGKDTSNEQSIPAILAGNLVVQLVKANQSVIVQETPNEIIQKYSKLYDTFGKVIASTLKTNQGKLPQTIYSQLISATGNLSSINSAFNRASGVKPLYDEPISQKDLLNCLVKQGSGSPHTRKPDQNMCERFFTNLLQQQCEIVRSVKSKEMQQEQKNLSAALAPKEQKNLVNKEEVQQEDHESYQPREHPSEESFRSDSRHSERQPRVDSSFSSSSSSRNPSNSYLSQPAVEDFPLKKNKQSQAPNKDVLYQGVRTPFEAITPEEEYPAFRAEHSRCHHHHSNHVPMLHPQAERLERLLLKLIQFPALIEPVLSFAEPLVAAMEQQFEQQKQQFELQNAQLKQQLEQLQQQQEQKRQPQQRKQQEKKTPTLNPQYNSSSSSSSSSASNKSLTAGSTTTTLFSSVHASISASESSRSRASSHSFDLSSRNVEPKPVQRDYPSSGLDLLAEASVPVPREVTMQAPSSHLSSLGTTGGSRGLGREQ